MDHLNCSDEYMEFIAGLHKYYSQTLTEFSAESWVSMAKEFGEQAVKAACVAHMRTPVDGKWMPKMADVIEKLEGSSKDQGTMAWTKFINAVRHYGSYSTVVFDDPIIHLVCRDMGGWIGFGAKTNDELPFIERDFINRYKSYKTTIGAVKDWPSRLVGVIEFENVANGTVNDSRYTQWPVVMIGDPKAAQKVLEMGVENEPTNSLVDVSKMLERISNNASA